MSINPFETSPEEHSETENQKASFCWLAMCGQFGRKAANDPRCYMVKGYAIATYPKASERVKLVCSAPFAVPNGTQLKGGARQGATLVAQGVKSGVCDIVVPVPMLRKFLTHTEVVERYTPGLFVEMKAPKGVVSDAQEKFMALMKSIGHEVSIEVGWLNTTAKIADYLEL